jgi:hypothetical protein
MKYNLTVDPLRSAAPSMVAVSGRCQGFHKQAIGLLVALGLPAVAADLTWFAFSDCHYGSGEPPRTTHEKVEWINSLPGSAFPAGIEGVVGKPRAVIMSGDLIDHGADAAKYPAEWASYLAEFGVNGEGKCKFPVFEGMGNHDWNKNLFMYDKIAERNLKRKELGYIQNISENGYHYSWDWDGIHFVNLNIFPGNQWAGEADTYGAGAHDPLFSRDFLAKDLKEKVGNSGRPVILIHHFRPIDENWWTFSAADKYHRIIQDYNVIVIMVGHQGGGVSNLWRGINWASSNGELEVFRVTPDNTLLAVGRSSQTTWNKPLQKKIYFSHETSGLPAVINNVEWTSKVTQNSATLSGKILYAAAEGSEVTIYWGKKDGGDVPGAWENSQKVGVKKVGEVFSAAISGLQPWTGYHYRCHVANGKGEAWAAASIPFTTRGTLPAGWATAFVGHEQRPWGGAHLEGDTITVRGSGRDIGEPGMTIDNCQYAAVKKVGDVAIQARLKGLAADTRGPLTGVMMRENLEAGGKSVSLLYSEREGIQLVARAQSDGKSSRSPALKIMAPVRLKLVRSGTTFTGYASADGKDWTQVGKPVSVEMSTAITAGLCVTAGNRDSSRNIDATFDGLEVK